MSVADTPFDSAWKIAKAPFYHSVNTDTSNPEVAEKLWALRDELMAEGITFDAGGGFPKGGRDWELDWSLSGATPDEVMIRMRDAGIPFTSTMRYVDELEPEAEARADQLNTYRDRKSDMEPVYQDAVGIGESKCPECGEMGMVIREPDESLTLACGDCGFMEEYQGGDFDEGVSKQFDQQRAEMARMQQAEQPPYVGDDEDLNLNIGGNQGECCEAFRQRMQGIFASTPYDNVMGNSHQYWDEVINSEPCEEIISSWNDHVKDLLEWDMKQAFDPNGDSPPHYHIIKDMIEDTLQAIEEYNSCERGGFEGVDFGGDFMASGDVFEDSWGVVKFDAERAGTARMIEQEQIPAEDEKVNVDLNPNGGEPDKCCLEALQLYQELTGDYTQSNPWIWSKGVEGGNQGHGGGELDCDELRGWLEWLVYDDVDSPQGIEQQAAKKVLEQWESCISEDFSGDFTASGDVFEDAWSVAKKERCWLCEKVKDTYGRYPNLPYYPPNWKRPCDCAGDF